jgi:hypothetical protein
MALHHSYGFIGASIGALTAAEAYPREDAFPILDGPCTEGASFQAFPQAFAAGRIGPGNVRAGDERVNFLAQFSVEDVRDAAAGAAVANNVFGASVGRAMDEDHLPHSKVMALSHDFFGFFFGDLTVIPWEGFFPDLSPDAYHDIGLQGVRASVMGNPAAARPYCYGAFHLVQQVQDLGEWDWFSRIGQAGERGSQGPSQSLAKEGLAS